MCDESYGRKKEKQLLHKDQDRCNPKDWRLISLLNVDARIASKVIAERIKNSSQK